MLLRLLKLCCTKIKKREIFFYAVLIGAISGLVASGFYYVLEFLKEFFNSYILGRELVHPAGETLRFYFSKNLGVHWAFYVLPVFGGLISGVLVYFFAPKAKGNGTDAMIKAFHREKGEIEPKIPLIKALASFFVISTNNSSGREGPILQVCGGVGSSIANIMNKNTKTRRIFLLAGAAGGLGAIFRAPLAGAITAIEVLYREDFETDALVPSIISSVTAYSVFSLIFGHSPIYNVGPIDFTLSDMGLYLGLGLLTAFFGRVYVRTFYFISDWFDNMKFPLWLAPVIGGALIGLLGAFVPEALGSGSSIIQEAFYGKFVFGAFFIIMLAKMLTTSLTIGSGASGGLFGPSLAVGAMLGGAYASALNHIVPGIIAYPSAFILVGMAGFFAGVASAPIGALLMVCEMTHTYSLLAPLLLVAVISILFSKRSIFKNQVKNKLFSLAHHDEVTQCVLSQKKAFEIMKRPKEDDVILNTTSIAEFEKLIQSSHNSDFIVINDYGKLLGGISILDFKIGKGELVEFSDKTKTVEEITKKISAVNIDDDLYKVLSIFSRESFYKLPVVDDANTVKGFLRYRDVLMSL